MQVLKDNEKAIVRLEKDMKQYIEIDGEKLEKYLSNKNILKKDFSISLGYSKSTCGDWIKSEKIPLTAYMLMNIKYPDIRIDKTNTTSLKETSGHPTRSIKMDEVKDKSDARIKDKTEDKRIEMVEDKDINKKSSTSFNEEELISNLTSSKLYTIIENAVYKGVKMALEE